MRQIMTIEEKQSLLYDYCRWNNTKNAKQILVNSGNAIDLFYLEGIYFKSAIKHNNVELLNILLDYYEKTKLSSDPESFEYVKNKYDLLNILEEAENMFEVSEEMQKILDQYIGVDDDDTDSEEEMEQLDYAISQRNNGYKGNYSTSSADDSLENPDNIPEQSFEIPQSFHDPVKELTPIQKVIKKTPEFGDRPLSDSVMSMYQRYENKEEIDSQKLTGLGNEFSDEEFA